MGTCILFGHLATKVKCVSQIHILRAVRGRLSPLKAILHLKWILSPRLKLWALRDCVGDLINNRLVWSIKTESEDFYGVKQPLVLKDMMSYSLKAMEPQLDTKLIFSYIDSTFQPQYTHFKGIKETCGPPTPTDLYNSMAVCDLQNEWCMAALNGQFFI